MTPYQIANQSATLQVVSFIIQETGSYNDQFLRPYETDISAATMSRIVNLASEAASTGRKILPTSLNQVNDGASLVTPSTRPEAKIEVPNGWSTRRFRFLLVVDATKHVGGTTRYYYTGYSEHNDCSINGQIDPRMQFYINSAIRTRITEAVTPMQGIIRQQTFTSGRHVIANNNWSGALANNQQYMMRPVDIYTNMELNDLRQQSYDVVNDTRIMSQREAAVSEFYDALPHEYTSKILNTYITAAAAAPTYGAFNTAGDMSFANAAVGLSMPFASEDPLMPAIAAVRDFGLNTNWFTIGELNRIDPNADNVTKFFPLEAKDYSLIHTAGQTASWHGEDGVTLAAIKIGQAIPALLSTCMLQSVNFSSTNSTITTAPETTISFADGFTKDNIPARCNAFITRFETEVLPTITYNNQLPYYLEVRANLLNETWIRISINGCPMYDYALPTFCDSLYTPVITSSFDRTQQVASDFSALLSEVGGSPQVMSAPDLVNSYL